MKPVRCAENMAETAAVPAAASEFHAHAAMGVVYTVVLLLAAPAAAADQVDGTPRHHGPAAVAPAASAANGLAH